MSHTTAEYVRRNEDGHQQITLVTVGFHHWLANVFKEHTLRATANRTEVWVDDGLCWVNKKTGIPADKDKEFKLFNIKAEQLYLQKMRDFGLKV